MDSGYANSRNLHNFYDALKLVYGPKKRLLAPVTAQDGSTLFTGKIEIMAITRNPSPLASLQNIPAFSMISELCESPSLHEVTGAINNLKNSKSPGPDGIPAELLKYGGTTLLIRLHPLIQRLWQTDDVPQQCKAAWIISIYKQKDDRGSGGKVLVRIILAKLNTHIVKKV